MCGALPIIGAVVGSALLGGMSKPKAPSMPNVQGFSTQSALPDVSAPPPPVSSPTFGQKSAEEMQKEAGSDVVRKNKKGRSALRIDKDPVTPVAGSAQIGSGTVVPRG